MTEKQAVCMVLEQANKPRVIVDARPWWRRLVGSLRVVVKPGRTFKRPVKEIGVSGGIEF